MDRLKRSVLSCFMAVILFASLCSTAFASGQKADLSSAVEKTAAYLLETVTQPQFGSGGGEWVILGLARSGVSVPQSYWDQYYAAVERYVTDCQGVLHTRRYTEYSRVIVALSAIGKDPANIAGYNLLTPLGDYSTTVGQGLNGAIWALIALDSGSYDMPVNSGAKIQATRQMYVDLILSRQMEDGGWNLSSSGRSDTDMTAMALQALAKYQDQAEVKAAVDRALEQLSKTQLEDGGFSSYGVANAESCVQVVVALCELGVDLSDPRFVKDGNSVLDRLLDYQNGDGSFLYQADDAQSSARASEHALYALAAARRAAEGKSSLYRMDDVDLSQPDSREDPVETPPEVEQPQPLPPVKTRETPLLVLRQDSLDPMIKRGWAFHPSPALYIMLWP